MKKTLTLFTLAVTLAASSAMADDEVYRWIDSNGVVKYSDLPPENVESVKVQRTRPGSSDATPSYAMRKASADFPFVLYTMENCTDPCEDARTFLKGRGIPFTEKKIASDEDVAAFKQQFKNNDLIPAATVGIRQLSGFESDAWNAMLNKVGYPAASAR